MKIKDLNLRQAVVILNHVKKISERPDIDNDRIRKMLDLIMTRQEFSELSEHSKKHAIISGCFIIEN